MSVTLRTALPGDREAVVDLILALNVHEADLVGDRRRDRGGAAAYYDELQQRLAKRDGRIVLAVAGGRAVAAMGFCIDEDAAYVTPDVRRHGTITDLVVGEAWRGVAYERKGAKQEAIESYQRALSVESGNATAKQGLSRVNGGISLFRG